MFRLFTRLQRASAARPRRACSVAGIALGVALGYGVHLVNRAAVDDLAASVRELAGEADLEVRGGRTDFRSALYPRIARLPGVAQAQPALELDAGIAGTERTLRVIGIDSPARARTCPAMRALELLEPDKVLSRRAPRTLGGGERLAAGRRPEDGRARSRGRLPS